MVSYFNWLRTHSRLKTTAAQKAGLADCAWTWNDMLCHPTIVWGTTGEGLSAEEIRGRLFKAIELKRQPENSNIDIQPQSDTPQLILEAGLIAKTVVEVVQVLGSLSDPRSRLYVFGSAQGYILVRVLRAVATIDAHYLSIDKDNDFIDREITTDSLQFLINQTFEIWGPKKRVNCPAFLAKQIIARERWPELPILRGIIHSPLLTKTGEVITELGCHKGTGYLLTFNPGEFQITINPYPIWRLYQIAAAIPIPDQMKIRVGQGFLFVLFII